MTRLAQLSHNTGTSTSSHRSNLEYISCECDMTTLLDMLIQCVYILLYIHGLQIHKMPGFHTGDWAGYC